MTGLLGLLAIPALLAAYFLRRRQPPRTVSALFLWKTPDQRAEAGPRLNRFSRELSLALEILAVLFAVLFLVDLRCGERPAQQHVVIVLDGSLSMNASVGGTTAAERAKTEVAAIAQRENAGVLTLIETGLRPTVLAGPQQTTDRALATLERWTPAQPAHDVNPAFTLARELAGAAGHRVFFVTDGPLPEAAPLPGTIEARSVGQRASNVALISAQRRDEHGFAQVTVRVANFGDTTVSAPVRFSCSDAPAQSHTVSLPPGGTSVLRVGFKSLQAIDVQLDDDALREDGHVTLLPSPLAEVSVSLLAGLDAPAQVALRRFVTIAAGVTLTTPSTLTFGPPDSQATVRVGAVAPLKSFVGPFFAQKGDALLDDVQLGGVVWTAGENPPGRVLMSAGDVVLISESDDGTLHLNLDVGRSNLQRTVAWPVLLSNVVRRARLSSPGFPRKHLMLGEEVPVVVTAGSTWELQSATAGSRPVMGTGALTLSPLSAPGRWTLKKDGEVVDTLVVLPLDPRESDLRTRGPWDVRPAQPSAFASLATTSPRPWWPLLVVLGLVVLDLWLTAAPRRKEVAP